MSIKDRLDHEVSSFPTEKDFLEQITYVRNSLQRIEDTHEVYIGVCSPGGVHGPIYSEDYSVCIGGCDGSFKRDMISILEQEGERLLAKLTDFRKNNSEDF